MSGGSPPSVVMCGRKFCSRCGRWRLLMDFGRDRSTYSGYRLICRTCERLRRGTRRSWRQTGFCMRGHRFTPENTYVYADGRRQCRTCTKEKHREWVAKNRESRNEYQRIWAEGQRRAQATPVRELKEQRRVKQAHDEHLRLPAGPFRDWLNSRQVDTSWKDWCDLHEIDLSNCNRIRDGRQKLVHVDTVDKVLQIAGYHLDELYPYEEKVAA